MEGVTTLTKAERMVVERYPVIFDTVSDLLAISNAPSCNPPIVILVDVDALACVYCICTVSRDCYAVYTL